MVNKGKYCDLMKGSFKPLGYYADELFNTTTDFDFFNIIATQIVPLIRQSPAFERFYCVYAKEKNSYLTLHAKLETQAKKEVERVSVSLKAALEKLGIINKTEIKQQVDDIAQVFAKKNMSTLPPYHVIAYEKLCSLLEYLLEIGCIDIMQNYATITLRTVKKHEGEEWTIQEVKQACIQYFTFAPSLIRLRTIEEVWRWEFVRDSWVAWEYLFLVAWCWNTEPSFFGDEDKRCEVNQSCMNNIDLLVLQDYWLQIDNIKRRQTNQPGLFFRRDFFTKYLKLILNHIIIYQESHAISSSDVETTIEGQNRLYSVELRLDKVRLRLLLDVQLAQDEKIYTYVIHRFREAFKRWAVILYLFDSILDEKINIAEVSRTETLSVAKFLKDTKLNNIVGKIFFDKINTVTLVKKAGPVLCASLSSSDLAALKEHISTLKLSQ
jgi:hypothetical protein